MHFLKVSAVIAITASLTACVTPSDNVGSPPPSIETIAQLGKVEYTAKYGRAPINYRVTKVQRVNVFAHRLDHLVCIETTETRRNPVYNNNAQIIHEVGSNFTARYAHIIRDYKHRPGQWTPTLFRRVSSAAEMGNISSLSDFCPRSKS